MAAAEREITRGVAALVLDTQAELGEGAIWDQATGTLLWVDITRHLVHRFDPVTGLNAATDVGQPVGSVVTTADGRLMLASEKGFAFLAAGGSRLEILAEPEAGKPNRMNDGKCDRSGRYWAGSMSYDEETPSGALYCLHPDHAVTVVLTDITISNGIAWSPDERRMYYIDTPTHGVDCFDYEAETAVIGNRRRLITVPDGLGAPDGMTVDAEGYLWVALWGGGAVRRYSPEGTLDYVVEVPATQVTSCAFGGPDLGDLYITTASIHLSAEQRAAQPHAGALYRYRPGVQGLPARVYRG